MENHCSRRQRTRQSSGNRNTDRRGRRRGDGEGGEGRQRAGPGQRPRPRPRDPAKCSCPRSRPRTQGEGQQSSHSRLQCFSAFLDQKFSSQREGHSRQQAPWSPRQALQAGGMSPGTGSSWQVRGDDFQEVGRDWRTRDWLVSGGDRALRRDRELLFRPEGRKQQSWEGWGLSQRRLSKN